MVKLKRYSIIKSLFTVNYKPIIIISLFTCTLLFNLNFAIAQMIDEGNSNDGNVNLPTFHSPNSATFTQYAITPVSPNTGIPQIDIPIYIAKAGDIELPISLSYHASGIKIEDIASWVGLGCNLNVGGAITRQVKGYPDIEYEPISKEILDACYYAPYRAHRDSLFEIIDAGKGYIKDSDPDIFTFNFNGYTGQFLKDFYTDEIYIFSNDRDLRIKFIPSTKNFSITTPEGICYKFNSKEYNHEYSRSGGKIDSDISSADFEESYPYCDGDDNGVTDGRYVSSWYLSEIESLKTGHKITFVYDDSYFNNVIFSQTSGYKLLPVDNFNSPDASEPWSESKTEQKCLTLKEINMSTGIRIKFNTGDEQRKDLIGATTPYGAKFLRNIVVYHSNHMDESPYIYSFDYDYFCVDGKTTDEARYTELRLKLKSFQEKGKTPYYFYYNTEHNLPARVYVDFKLNKEESYAKDFLGYYNGESSNTGLFIPYHGVFERYVSGISSPVTVTINENGANREPDLEYCQTYTLNKIVYPTGGSTEYTYELHDYYFIGKKDQGDNHSFPGLRIKEIVLKDSNEDIIEARTYKYRNLNTDYSDSSTSSGVLIRDPKFVTEKLKPYIELGDDLSGGITRDESRTYLMIASHTIYSMYDFTGGVIGYSIVKEEFNGNGFIIYKYNTAKNGIDDYDYHTYILYYQEFNISENIYSDVSKDLYNISEHWNSYYYRRGQLTEKIFLNENLRPVNGITYYYKYNFTANIINGIERLVYHPNRVYFTNFYGFRSGSSRLSSVVNFHYNNLDTIRYLKDSVHYDYNDYGHIISKYTFTSNEEKVSTLYKYPQDISFDESEENDCNEYCSALRDQFLTCRDDCYWSNDTLEGAENCIYSDCEIPIEAQCQGCVTGEIFNFSVCLANCENDKPLEQGTDGRAIKAMVEKNMINIPIQVIEKRDDNVIGGKITKYKRLDKDIIVPAISYSIETTEPIASVEDPFIGSEDTLVIDKTFKDKIYFDSYDEYGNITQYHKTGDIPTSYLWGYNNTLPVAKIVGLSYDEVTDKVSPDDIQQKTGEELSSMLAPLRDLDAMVTIYTYDPLIGMTSMTDENGLTTHYEYDNFGRLKCTRDDAGNITNTYKYHYAGQNGQ